MSDAPLQTVFIVDDDEAFRDSVGMLCESVGLTVQTFGSADDFLEEFVPVWNGCLVLDIRMPRKSGLELQKELNELGSRLPVIFMTGHGDIAMAVGAMKAGAFDFLTKPFSHQELLDRIHKALAGAREVTDSSQSRQVVQARHEKLTPRESEVFDLVVEGCPNKVIASRLDISQRTVELHRAQVMAKMEAESLAELVRMAVVLEG
jgi:FixJ family two-component response regulator